MRAYTSKYFYISLSVVGQQKNSRFDAVDSSARNLAGTVSRCPLAEYKATLGGCATRKTKDRRGSTASICPITSGIQFER
jgi:hypothetical protein